MTDHQDADRGKTVRIHVDPDLADLIPGFLDNRRKDIAVIEEALGRGDFETVRVLGHSMKGAGGGYGFDAITEIGAALEQAAKGKNPDGVLNGLRALSAYLDHVEVVND